MRMETTFVALRTFVSPVDDLATVAFGEANFRLQVDETEALSGKDLRGHPRFAVAFTLPPVQPLTALVVVARVDVDRVKPSLPDVTARLKTSPDMDA